LSHHPYWYGGTPTVFFDHLAEAQNAELASVALASIAMIVIAEKLRMILAIGRFEFARCMMWRCSLD
jgi:hypothetical protein